MPRSAPPPLLASDVSVTLGGESVVSGLDLRVEVGDLVALVGPNGAGKTTALRALAGLVASTGSCELQGRPVSAWTAAERARRLALVRQATDLTAAFSVRDLVELGRAPHVGWLARLGADDHAAVGEALDAMELRALAERDVTTLSGGEQQRVLLAQALAQDPAVLLLDEPTAHLDIRHQLDLLARIRRQCDAGRAVVVALHDLSLAARFADRIAVLDRGSLVAEGVPEAVLTAELILRVFGVRAEVARTEDGLSLRYLLPEPSARAAPPSSRS